MQAINDYVNNELFLKLEGVDDNIILKNLKTRNDNEVIEILRDYVGDNIDPAHALKIYGELKSKFGYKTSLWQVANVADIDKYDSACHAWARNVIKKYKYDSGDENLLVGIAYMVNGL